MPADKKVSVGWQIFFTFIPIADLWAFYRIRKLRRYLLYVVVPEIIIQIIIGVYVGGNAITDFSDLAMGEPETPFDESLYWHPLVIASYVVSIAVQALAIYLVIIWSRQHNRQYDQPTLQPSG